MIPWRSSCQDVPVGMAAAEFRKQGLRGAAVLRGFEPVPRVALAACLGQLLRVQVERQVERQPS